MINYLIFYGAALLFYLADALQKITSVNQHGWSFVFYRSIYTTLIAFIACLIFSGTHSFPEKSKALEIMAVATCCGLGFYFYIQAINATRFSNVGSLSIIGTVFQVMIGCILFKEPFQWPLIPIMLLMSAGNIMQLLIIRQSNGAKFVLLSVFFWTVGYAALSRVLQGTNVLWSVPLMEMSILILSGLMLLISNSKWSVTSVYRPVFQLQMILIGVFIFAASYLNHLCFQQIPISVISFLQLTMLPLNYMLSLKIFKEKPTPTEWVSFILGLIGFGCYVWLKQTNVLN
jgi:drug/metabolite transporter (DMT)-like permease